MPKNTMKGGFTLIELLIVVAIIAIIGAGVGVMYNRLDDRAKVAMEMNDIGALSKTISHWSFLHDGSLPNKLDSLVTTDGNLYSAMSSAMSTGEVGNGLGMQAGFTFVAAEAPAAVLSGLNTVGIDTVYMHLADKTPANDSTFETSSSGAKIADVSQTLALLDSDPENTQLKAQAIVDYAPTAEAAIEANANDPDNNPLPAVFRIPWTDTDGNTQMAVVPSAMWASQYADAEEKASANLLKKLAFVYPGGGTQMAMNLANEIILNAGLNPDLVASPDMEAADAIAAKKMYWLVVFGLGRFATIYEGNGARVEAPVAGKRYTDSNYYNRYLVVVKVPVTGYDNMTGQNAQKAVVASVLSPIGLSRTRLQDTYDEAVEATAN